MIKCLLFQKQCNEGLNDFQTFKLFHNVDIFFPLAQKWNK